MYVIYINDRPLVLRGTQEADYATATPDRHLRARYSGKRKTLLHYVDTLEKGSPKVGSVELVSDDLEGLWKDFRTHFRWIAAAGGLVRLAGSERHLFIFRRGSWDLPKGKIDDGEERLEAALREVEEETGVTDLTPGKALPTSYHTYKDKKDRRVLKPTYWFRMETEQRELVPEAAEDIERAEWREIDEVLGEKRLYANLRGLLQNASA